MRRIFSGAGVYDSAHKKFVRKDVVVEDGKVCAILDVCNAKEYTDCEIVRMRNGLLIAPGLVDVHTHGRAGGDFVTADCEMLRRMRTSYLAVGVTGVMATLASAETDQLLLAAGKIADLAQEDKFLLGIHLEGRYLNEKKRGAHAPALLSAFMADELEVLVAAMRRAGHVHVSAALELDFDGSFAKRALDMGCSLGLAHTAATYEQAKEAFEDGATSLTHTFNAMSPLHHRDGGAVAAAFLDESVWCELIADGLHVSPEMVTLAYRMKKDRLVLVSDSMEATGNGDGEYSIAGMPVTVREGRAITHDGAIAGSTLNLLDATKNLARFADIPFETALYNSTAAPARMIGAYDSIGSIETGKRANFIVLDENFDLISTVLDGETVYTV